MTKIISELTSHIRDRPSPKGGIEGRESLSSYKRNVAAMDHINDRGLVDGFGYLSPAQIEFNIERQLDPNRPKGSDKNFVYSFFMMAFYKPRQSGPSYEEFLKTLLEMGGFKVQHNDVGYETFPSENYNTTASWNIHERGRWRRNDLGIIVQNKEPTTSLGLLVQDIPYSVFVFNKINPNRTVDEGIMSQAIVLATKNDSYFMGKKR